MACRGSRFPIGEIKNILDMHHEPGSQLWDCRNLDEWRGQKRLRGARKSGRIPWANHLPWQLFRAEPKGGSLFYREETIVKVIKAYRLDKTKRHYFYCQSGVRTTVAMLALYRLGWDPQNLINFDGSWRAWSRDDALPSHQEMPRPAGWRSRFRRVLVQGLATLRRRSRDASRE